MEKSLADEEKLVVEGGDAGVKKVSLGRRLAKMAGGIASRIRFALSTEKQFAVEKQRIIGTPYDLLDLLRREFGLENRGAFIFFKDFAIQWDTVECKLKNDAFNPDKIKEALKEFLLNTLGCEKQLIMREGFLKVDGEINGPVFFIQYIKAAERVLKILPCIHPEERERLNGWQTSI